MSEIDPHEIIRRKDGQKYFGFSDNMIDTKIKTGEIPAPMALSANGRAKGWLGSQIIEHHARIRRNNEPTAA
jgi:predicted DNA-binding transcriptional regulator AlpA